MTAGRRRQVLLGILLFLLLLVGWQRLKRHLGGPAASAVAESGGRAGGEARSGDVPEVVDLDVDKLANQPGSYHPGRDLFRFAPPPPPPGPTPEELAARRKQEEAERIAQQQVPAVPPPPQPPPIDLTYLGSFGRTGRRIAVFSDGENIYNALQGDVLEGKFIVADIGYESVLIRFVGFPEAAPRRLAPGS